MDEACFTQAKYERISLRYNQLEKSQQDSARSICRLQRQLQAANQQLAKYEQLTSFAKSTSTSSSHGGGERTTDNSTLEIASVLQPQQTRSIDHATNRLKRKHHEIQAERQANPERYSREARCDGEQQRRHLEKAIPAFVFKLVSSWTPSGEMCLSDPVQEGHRMESRLVKAIETVKDFWEDSHGLCWFEDERFHRESPEPICITNSLRKRRTAWHGATRGRYACINCVEQKLPCFTQHDNSFLLLPLHPEDRQAKVMKHTDSGNWVNK